MGRDGQAEGSIDSEGVKRYQLEVVVMIMIINDY